MESSAENSCTATASLPASPAAATPHSTSTVHPWPTASLPASPTASTPRSSSNWSAEHVPTLTHHDAEPPHKKPSRLPGAVSMGFGGLVTASQYRHIMLALGLGTMLEWYDFMVYSNLNAPISNAFFPAGNPTLDEFAYWAIFAVGLVARPLGAIIFGHIGDSRSRRSALLWSILLMVVPTVLIGCLPTYAHIGWGAPILLAILRLIQGLALGGELGSASVYAVELAHRDHRGLSGGLITLSINVGVLSGVLMVMLMEGVTTTEELNLWGWRIPFLIVIFTGSLGIMMRMHIPEPEEFLEAMNALKEQEGRAPAPGASPAGGGGEAAGADVEGGSDESDDSEMNAARKAAAAAVFEKAQGGQGRRKPKPPLYRLLRNHAVGLVLQWGLMSFLGVLYYTWITWIPSYLREQGVDTLLSQGMLASCQLFQFAAILLSGQLADLGMPTMVASALITVVFTGVSYGALAVIGTVPPIASTWVLMGVVISAVGFFLGYLPVSCSIIYPPEARVTGYAFAHACAFGVLGGLTPEIITGLRAAIDSEKAEIYAPAFWLTIVACLSVPSAVLLRKWYPHVNKPSRRQHPRWP